MPASNHESHTAADLLAYEPFIRSIARTLIADESRVSDIVQETMLRALTKPPRQEGSFKGWLGRVTRNLAVDERRRDGTRKHREKVVAREEASEDARGLELHGNLVAAVLALDEPYKNVVLLRYYRDMSPTQIAKKLDRKPATVRSQLKRAHELLKERMDHEFNGDRTAWVALCVPLAAKRTAVLSGSVVLTVAAALLAATVAATVHWWPAELKKTAEHQLATVSEIRQRIFGEAQVGENEPHTQSPSKTRIALVATRSVLVTQDGVPAPDTNVWCLAPDALPKNPFRRLPYLAMDTEGLSAKYGEYSRTNVEGYAQFDVPSEEFALLAVRDFYQAFLSPEETSAPNLEAKLEEVSIVRVQVRDTANKVVTGIPVSLLVSNFDPVLNRRLGPSPYTVMARSTEEDTGLAFFRGFTTLFASELDQTWIVQLNVPGLSTQKTTFRIERANPETPVVLQLGATGSLVVRSVDMNGELLTLPGTVLVQGTQKSEAHASQYLVDGVACFPFIAANAPLKVTLSIPSLGASWKREFTGPNRAGDSISLDVRQPRAAKLRGRVLDATGSPLANTKAALSIFDVEYKLLQRRLVKTNSKGLFTAELDLEHVSKQARITLVRNQYWGGVLVCESEAPVKLAAPTTELGDLHLREYREGISGHCVTKDGTPLAGIYLSSDLIPGFQGSGAITNSDGEFRLPGPFSDTALITTDGSFDWILPEPALVSFDQEDVELVLARPGSIEGAVLVEDGVDPGTIAVVAYDESDEEDTSTSCKAFAHCDPKTGRFALKGLPTGSYKLYFSLANARLREISGVRVTISETSSDPRVELVDLRDTTRTVDIAVVDSRGVPVPARRSSALALSADGRIGFASSAEDGKIRLSFTDSPNVLIYVSGAEYRGTFVEIVNGKGKAILQDGIPVELRTSQRLTTRTDTAEYAFMLQRIEEDPALNDLQRDVMVPSALMENGTASVRFPAPGTYRLHYSRQSHPDSDGAVMISVPAPVEGDFTIEVPDTDLPITIDLPLPSELPVGVPTAK